MALKKTGNPQKVFAETLKLARIGSREAQYEVALMYANGVGAPQDLQQALDWVRKAAERGLAAAQYLLASRYAQGVVVEKDELMALRWYQNAADQGHAKAHLKLGQWMAQPHPEAAFKALRKAADQGVTDAQYALGLALLHGDGCEPDPRSGLDWLLRAAEQGMAAAQCTMGDLYIEGRHVVADTSSALGWYRLASRQGFARAQLALEQHAPTGERRAKGRKKPSAAERRQSESRWLQVAEAGDSDTKYCVGLMLAQGLGMEANEQQAQGLLMVAAQQGHWQAAAALGALLEPNDPDAAFRWYEQAARHGDTQAQHGLARLLAQAYDPERQLHALTLQLQAAQVGYGPAQLDAAHTLERDTQVLRADLLNRAARAGVVEAQYLWAQCLSKGLGVNPDQAQAFYWWEQAAQAGHVEAACEAGSALLAGDGVLLDEKTALHWLQQAAQAGSAKAQWKLGGAYASGKGGVPPDIKQAFVWCQRAAHQDFAPAQATLGVLYEHVGKPQEALNCLRRAADVGDAEAQYNLALLLSKNQVETALEEAFVYLERAAQQGVASAQSRLALAYGQGHGVAADGIEAHKWLLLASRRGDALAKTNLAYSRSQLNLMQIKEAERRADAWRPQIPIMR